MTTPPSNADSSGVVLVTGSSGHLGEALMRALLSQRRRCIGIDLLPSPFTTVVGSINDRGLLEQLFFAPNTLELPGPIVSVIHTATLHRPHIETHSEQEFVDVNVSGTLALLEVAVKAKTVQSFVYSSTTSAFGSALTSNSGDPLAATWISEEVAPIPRNIYGATKTAAEGLCELYARTKALPCVVLRIARFFPEEDLDPDVAARYSTENSQANELLHRRVDISDVVDAHLLAVARAPALGFERCILSGTSPFQRHHLGRLPTEANKVIEELFPQAGALFATAKWHLPSSIDRVYINDRARNVLGWAPRYSSFSHVLDCLAAGRDFRSPMAATIGRKGYHRKPLQEDA